MNLLERLVVVLVRSEGPLNVGSVARLCGNFGCSLRLVNPQMDRTTRDAIKMAHPSEALLEEAPVFTTLRAALSDVSLAVATSSKLYDAVETPWLSVGRARLFLPVAGERVALVFGNERTGLSVDEAELCPRVVRLPTPGPTESLNLSHSVAVMLTLFNAAAEGTDEKADFRASKPSRDALVQMLSKQLEGRGFFKGGARAREAFEPRLQELTDKMDLSERDLVLLQDVLLVLSGTK
ncbi:MAG: RNA methyltransferase [Archangium sp.]|nr:RNA methyltransferase [Archangium sp.]MDP3575956.1 RNA methyltransferase [Archangium sp.]